MCLLITYMVEVDIGRGVDIKKVHEIESDERVEV